MENNEPSKHFSGKANLEGSGFFTAEASHVKSIVCFSLSHLCVGRQDVEAHHLRRPLCMAPSS